MTERELDTIIRLIPLSTHRQMGVISGQIKIHGELLKKKKGKKKNPTY